MRLPKYPIALPMLCAYALAASGCAGRDGPVVLFPPSADLQVEAKPVPGNDIVTSAAAAAEYDVKLESWGERGWRTVARLCRYFAGHGMAVDCPPAEGASGQAE